jgi:hypothetical protein
MTALAILHKDEIIRRVSQGHSLSSIAQSLGLSKQAISKQLTDDPEYQAAIQDYHDSRIDAAEQMILESVDQVDVARARSYWSSVSWRAERLDRRYAAKQEMSVTQVSVDINGLLDQRMARIASSVQQPIDSTCSQVETDAS